MADPDNNQDGVNSSAARADEAPQGAAGKKTGEINGKICLDLCKILFGNQSYMLPPLSLRGSVLITRESNTNSVPVLMDAQMFIVDKTFLFN